MSDFYLKIDCVAGKLDIFEEYVDDNGDASESLLLRADDPGDLQASDVGVGLTISSATTGKSYLSNYSSIDKYKTKALGSSTWVVVQDGFVAQEIQAVLNRSNNVVVSDNAFNISDFVKPDLTEGHNETTEFVHDGDVDNGGAVILDSNSALIGFQAGTFVKATENIVDGRPYGRVQINLDKADGSGGSAEAIDIRQGNVVSYPIISVSGATTFAQDVEFEEDVILTSPDGSRYKLLVSNNGGLSTQAI